ncbi:pyridoxal phosphate-dependent aminotransferase [Gloeobacter morelensis]|uniref:Aminotransferase class I/II-fold pyridoxal phosphate-dependent enzyme n=1 Tax=Gloeobacter morelensis MG652769 TaxID=2781736 RepID=A0ABY3PQQ6_9CYAN|nr:aminotransferase class I/II-fold pyridoxal phosphate-dependent enzyme [Gloeobacter morelensis]UFP96043.1 aminotransferase class I/II-fold pyridoxal phosphate-dependent enzyme [Gloeobacter morelensis MG652769]
MVPPVKHRLSERARAVVPSLIRDASRYCDELGALNLAQGLPDFAAPAFLKEAAQRAIAADRNQYCDPWGLAQLREAIAAKCARDNALAVDPATQVTVCCGATEGLNLALMALLDPGDEVVVFSPFYENYRPNLATVEAKPRYVPLSAPDWRVDEAVLERAFAGTAPRAVIVNNPANPTGKVWSRQELELVARYCERYDAYAITDEIYEYILYDGAEHISLAALAGMAERTVTVSGLSKTFCVTGWRLGYVIASEPLTAAIRRLHDFLTICAPAPMQHAAVAALEAPADYYADLRRLYQAKRDRLVTALYRSGFEPVRPAGAYYVWTDAGVLGAKNALEAAGRLAIEAGIAAVPGDCFLPPGHPNCNLRFCYAKSDQTLAAAVERLDRWSGHG